MSAAAHSPIDSHSFFLCVANALCPNEHHQPDCHKPSRARQTEYHQHSAQRTLNNNATYERAMQTQYEHTQHTTYYSRLEQSDDDDDDDDFVESEEYILYAKRRAHASENRTTLQSGFLVV